MEGFRYWVLALCAAVSAIASSSFASESANRIRDWERIEIKGAQCGDGLPYSVFLRRGDPHRIVLNLMGGGACWSAATCWGPTKTTWIHPLPFMPDTGGIVSDSHRESPLAGTTMVYLPYCTGDVHAGNHVAKYFGGVRVHHTGKQNVEKTLAQLTSAGLLKFDDADEVTLMGSSAGGLGALLHINTVDAYTHPGQRKYLIADAPGLHFSNGFWKKFTPELLKDFASALGVFGFELNMNDGMLAPGVPKLCASHPDWKIGLLQGTRDFVMSAFGELRMRDHRKLVLSDRGFFALTSAPDDNCSSWIAETKLHTFTIIDASARVENSSGVSAMDFVRQLYLGGVNSGVNSR